MMMETGNQKHEDYLAAGVMSGTSGDGLDLALCRFSVSSGRWKFKIIKASTVSYRGTGWDRRLESAMGIGGLDLMELHRDFGRFTAEMLNIFLKDVPEKPDIIASHGHTIFHQPEKGLTFQAGDGAFIAAITGITTVCDFRRLDVALGGQGAPLVPLGDELLFGQYSYCLNLGGFANISYRDDDRRIAFDICPVNIVLNRLAQELGHVYDDRGGLASTGSVNEGLLQALENLNYYRLGGPRSLGREWVDKKFIPVLGKFNLPAADKLRTVCEHIALRIASTVNRSKNVQDNDPGTSSSLIGQNVPAAHDQGIPGEKPGSMLITGGGAKNSFLSGLISLKAPLTDIVIPEETLVDYKEAIIFALLGLLRIRNQVSCLSTVTGASHDNFGGIVHLMPRRGK
jgi:anhydro-N-acetylmuramic acid kinase